MEGFEGLDSAFGLSGTDENIEDIHNQLAKIEEKKQEIMHKADDLMLVDQVFLVDEMKTLIMSARTVMRKLETDIKIGSAPRQFEVYAELLNSVGNQYKSLLELNKIILDAKIKTNQMNLEGMKKNDKIELTSEQLMDIVEKARENSQMRNIEAKFIIEDDEKIDDDEHKK